jgi:hypothetical protein
MRLSSFIHKVLESTVFDKSTTACKPSGDDVRVEAFARSFVVL